MAEGNVKIPYISEESEEGTTTNAGIFVSNIDWTKNIMDARVVGEGGYFFCDIRPSLGHKVVALVKDEANIKTNFPVKLFVYKLNL